MVSTIQILFVCLLIVSTGNLVIGDQNTTEPPLVPYNEADAYEGDPIIIDLDPNVDVDDQDEDRFLAEYTADTTDDNSTDIQVDRPNPEGEGEDRIIYGYYARNGWFPMKARIWPRFQSLGSRLGNCLNETPPDECFFISFLPSAVEAQLLPVTGS